VIFFLLHPLRVEFGAVGVDLLAAAVELFDALLQGQQAAALFGFGAVQAVGVGLCLITLLFVAADAVAQAISALLPVGKAGF
jgi:hypothetical protein